MPIPIYDKSRVKAKKKWMGRTRALKIVFWMDVMDKVELFDVYHDYHPS
jgi:hypothetical protein